MVIKYLEKRILGQALVEYLLVMVFMILILFNFTKGLNSILGQSMGSLRVILSDELSTGICPNSLCIHQDEYGN